MNKNEIESFLTPLEETYDRGEYDRFLKKAKIESSCPTIHIVGSNGKSATARYLARIYEECGYKVGLLTNAYLDSSLECIQIDGEPASEEAFSDFVEEHSKLLKKMELTRWQILAAFALDSFAKNACDLVILESNLGGDIDPSYVEGEDQRLVILTSLSLEHTSILGTTLSQIGLNKISLLDSSSKLLIPSLDDEMTKLLREAAEEVDSSFFIVDAFHFEKLVDGRFSFTYQPYKNIEIPAKTHYLIKDASLALEATSILKEEFPVQEEKVYEALSCTRIPMALEECGAILFDGNSNTEASEALVNSLRPFANLPIHLIFATEEESNIASMMPFLANFCATVTLTTLSGHPRLRKEQGYFFYSEDFRYIEDPIQAYEQMRLIFPNDYILFSGSKDFVRAMRKRFVR